MALVDARREHRRAATREPRRTLRGYLILCVTSGAAARLWCNNYLFNDLSRISQHDSPYLEDAPTRRAPSPAPATRAAPKPAPRAEAARRPIAPALEAPAPARAKRSRRRGKAGGKPSAGPNHLTSQPTTRNAYVETRAWLLAQHGPVCAYCGVRFTAGVMTLDHVAPRRGQTAYDRRDNLVLACPGCNAAKRDLAPTAFLLGARVRAGNLLRFGAHLSPMLLDIARTLAPADCAARNGAAYANGSNGAAVYSNGATGAAANSNGANGATAYSNGANGGASAGVWGPLDDLGGASPYLD